MIILFCFIIPLSYVLIKLVSYFLVSRFGKFSYDGISILGFSYDAQNDLFYSTKGAWQRQFGYCHLYDVAAPLFAMVIDTEPVRFYYNNKNYLLSFWKGQYGMVTGCEVGVYYTNQKLIDKNTLYLPVKDSDMLDISVVLYRKGEKIASVSKRHWWVTIFKLGMFSNPRDLSMDIQITFPNSDMLNAFLKSFKKLGYKDKNYEINNRTFSFTYKRPHTRKVWTRFFIADFFRQRFNYHNVKLYDKYLVDLIDDNMIDDTKTKTNDKLIMLNEMVPSILKNEDESIENIEIL